MIYPRHRTVVSYLGIPFLWVLLLMSIFSLVWLRSSIVSLEYHIGEMEMKRTEALKEKKTLAAELASLISIQQVEKRKVALVFPDRQKVVYVKRDEGGIPYTASLVRE